MRTNEKISFAGYAWRKYRTLLLALVVALCITVFVLSSTLQYTGPERDAAVILIVSVWFIGFGASGFRVVNKYYKYIRAIANA